MPQPLRDVLVMPAGGGKTTIARDPYYLDMDRMYSLEETQETYDRLNQQLLTRITKGQQIPMDAIDEHKKRITEYSGYAKCLLVHSLEVAELGGLHVKGVLIPTVGLHEEAITERHGIDKWLARKNRSVLLTQCMVAGRTPLLYGDWETLRRLLDERRDSTDPQIDTSLSECGYSAAPLKTIKDVSRMERDDEEYLIQILSSAAGCRFAVESMSLNVGS